MFHWAFQLYDHIQRKTRRYVQMIGGAADLSLSLSDLVSEVREGETERERQRKERERERERESMRETEIDRERWRWRWRWRW
jgi:uncharacterized protein YoxC